MMNRREAAIALDIPVEMAKKHGIPDHPTKAELEAIQTDPPAWLRQSMENRTGKRPVWLHLTCVVCGLSEAVRPKKWWPDFDLFYCYDHGLHELPKPETGKAHVEHEGIGNQMVGVVVEPA